MGAPGDQRRPGVGRRWDAFLLICGNLGLAGNWAPARRLLGRLAAMATEDAVLIGDSVDPSSDEATVVVLRRTRA